MKSFLAVVFALCTCFFTADGNPYLRPIVTNKERAVSNATGLARKTDFWQGEWLQLYSNFYVQSTSEIDFHCVKINSSREQDVVTIHKQAFQHGNFRQPIHWQNKYYISLQNNDSSTLNDNLLLTPVKNTSYVVVPLLLRSIDENYIIWTGLDNKTMHVWGKNVDQYQNNVILTKLSNLDFKGPYKTAKKSYSASCP